MKGGSASEKTFSVDERRYVICADGSLSVSLSPPYVISLPLPGHIILSFRRVF